jgi:hypothetical protein
MSDVKLSWCPVADSDDWDALVERSPQGTLFSTRAYLKAAGSDYRLYWIKQGAEIKAGAALMVSADGKNCELDDLVIYGGLLFDLDPSRQMVKRRHDEFQITEFFIGQIVAQYASVDIQLSPALNDLRPFLWHRYHDEERFKFRVDLRYTSCLDIASLNDFAGREEASPCFSRMETVRRYSIREARKKGGTVVVGNNGDMLVSFYGSLMQRQDTPQSEVKLANMSRVMDALLAAGRGAVYHAMNADGRVIYAVFYGWDAKRAYYLFGAGHPEISEPWQGTVVHWEAFRDLAQNRNIHEVDLEGVNSPQRGWFKLGLGGDLRPYYHVHIRG